MDQDDVRKLRENELEGIIQHTDSVRQREKETRTLIYSSLAGAAIGTTAMGAVASALGYPEVADYMDKDGFIAYLVTTTIACLAKVIYDSSGKRGTDAKIHHTARRALLERKELARLSSIYKVQE